MVTVKRILLTLVLLLAVSSTCFASSWYWICSSVTDNQWYIDNDSVQKNPYNATIWVKVSEPNGNYSLEQFTFDHIHKSYALLSYTDYDENGTVLDIQTIPYIEYNPIIPDTIVGIIYYDIWKK